MFITVSNYYAKYYHRASGEWVTEQKFNQLWRQANPQGDREALALAKAKTRKNLNLKDIYGRELVALSSLVIVIICFGIYPKIILEPLNISVTNHLQIMETKAIKIETKDKLHELNSIKGAEE